MMNGEMRQGAWSILFFCLAAMLADDAHAQERFRVDGERWEHRQLVFDNRFQHARYYPAAGFGVPALPPGSTAIRYGNVQFYFHSGVWFRPGPSGFLVIRPPLGIVVPALTAGYNVAPVGGTTYYYANETYYAPVAGGYAVVQPPAGNDVEAPAQRNAHIPAAPAAAPSAATNVWYYCASAQSYYPYVRECREGWRSVPAVPPGH